MALLKDSERALVEQCIAEVEKRTAAEIVVATLPRADDYGDVRASFATLGAIGLASLLHVVLPELTTGALLALVLVLFFALRFVLGLPAVLRRCVPRARVDAAMAAAAERMFLAHRVYATRGETGVLILLCEAEHRVTVLGDRAAHAVVRESGWEAHVKAIAASMRSGRAAEGLCNVVRALGIDLSRALPIQPGDVNELPNHVRF
jgi:putative membrane protein